MNGILLINKEKNMTSRDVVNIISKELKTKKVGHTGTLDPDATGVLVLAIGDALKLVDEITSLDKEYETEIQLGIETDTLDISGKVLKEKKIKITEQEIDKILNNFIGDYEMKVPKYSAIKVNGKKLYEYARENIDIKLPIKNVKIFELKRTSKLENNKFKIKCKVSKGTYIRSLIRDIGYKLNTYATMTNLNRTKQGKFDIKNCYTINDIKNNKYKLISKEEVLDIPKIEINEELYKKISNGNKIKNEFNLDKIAFIYKNKLIAIYIIDPNDNNILRPKKVFNQI